MSAVDAVVFDVGRVLVQWDMRHLFARLIDDPERLDWFMANVMTDEWHFQHDAGRDLDEMVAERKAQFPGHDDLIDAYATRFLETIPGNVPGSHEIVRELAQRQVPLFAITNFASPFWREFRANEPLFDLFGDIVVSGDEKLVKPDPRIFDLAVRRFGHEPGAMLFVDDNVANVEAARALGWHVHHFTDAGALRTDLTNRQLLG
ncbi:HAD family hydrolase [Novosphingobium mangrovi (ex Huang et al. 2023)]|uniref:HAD family phosphatase n=1 Tax=Novosphingobium mangrovi (ex Huang et al. 2023) TaxID=2976432 RepID=A0ABT2IA16_9SPHN|nr:HAD family phosphatase [Novosphingobium mangrovi (ex Huang et al. 2023)]MCT2401662.1 HAD family phosphatase [Novosphingobium mangrovi (ex Huang et al. 2023)]